VNNHYNECKSCFWRLRQRTEESDRIVSTFAQTHNLTWPADVPREGEIK
jgi:hypothetical protein